MKITRKKASFVGKLSDKLAPVVNSEKAKSYFGITFSLVTLSFFSIFAIRPTLITATTLITNVRDLKELDQKYEMKISSIIKAQSEYEKIRGNIGLLKQALPQTPKFTDVIIKIESLAASRGLSLLSLQVDDSTISDLPPSKPQPYNFSFTFTGDFDSQIEVIRDLNDWIRINNIISVGIVKEKISTSSSPLRFSIKGNTYYEP